MCVGNLLSGVLSLCTIFRKYSCHVMSTYMLPRIREGWSLNRNVTSNRFPLRLCMMRDVYEQKEECLNTCSSMIFGYPRKFELVFLLPSFFLA